MPTNTILTNSIMNKYQKEVAFIRKCAVDGQIIISNHAYEQIAKRKIKLADVYESIKSGVVIEIQTLEHDTKVLFQDCINNPPGFFSVVAVKSAFGLCVTAYIPTLDKWELGLDSQWRRRK